jgi:hypothetical protein
LVPGCGNGHDAIFFSGLSEARGLKIAGIDVAGSAIPGVEWRQIATATAMFEGTTTAPADTDTATVPLDIATVPLDTATATVPPATATVPPATAENLTFIEADFLGWHSAENSREKRYFFYIHVAPFLFFSLFSHSKIEIKVFNFSRSRFCIF